MKQKVLILAVMFILAVTAAGHVKAQTSNSLESADTLKIQNNEKLVILWSSGDREAALKMVFMYTYNAKKYEWWDDLTLLVWGPSAKLLSEDITMVGWSNDNTTTVVDMSLIEIKEKVSL